MVCLFVTFQIEVYRDTPASIAKFDFDPVSHVTRPGSGVAEKTLKVSHTGQVCVVIAMPSMCDENLNQFVVATENRIGVDSRRGLYN